MGRGENVHLRQGGFPYEESRRAGLFPELFWAARQGCGRDCLSFGHECEGTALIGTVRLALGWQQLLGGHEGGMPVTSPSGHRLLSYGWQAGREA